MSTISDDTSSTCHEKYVSFAGSTNKRAPARKNDTQLRDLVENACRWYQEGAKKPLSVGEIAIEDLLRLENLLKERELRIRFDWSCETNEAFLHMSTRIHEQPGVWFRKAMTVISNWLAGIALCGTPYLESSGTASCTIGPSKLSPDDALYLRYREDQIEGKPLLKRYTIPRVVLETAYSQSPDALLHKAWEYLIHSDDYSVHAVIIVVMKYPVADEHDFKAEATVWFRAATGEIEKDFPLDRCVHPTSEQHPDKGQHASALALSDTSSEERSPSASPTSPRSQTTWESSTTAVEHSGYEYGRYQPQRGGGWILRRSEPLVIYDETSSDPCARTFPLEAGDFLRPCDAQPDMYIPADRATIDLDLSWLQGAIRYQLALLRGLIQDETADGEQPPPPPPRVYPAALGKKRALHSVDMRTNRPRHS